MKIWAIFLGFVCVSHPCVLAAVAPWNLLGDDDGISVYERTPGDADVLEFRGVGEIDAPLDKLVSILTDETRAKEWAEDLVESRKIQVISPFEWLEYNHIGTPFIIKDRDIVNRVKVVVVKKENVVKILQQSIVTPLMPETRYVRADLRRAEFRLKPITPIRTLFDGEILIDPKGSMPKWIFNMFQRAWPRTTLEKVRKQAAKTDIVTKPHFKNLLGGVTPLAGLDAPKPSTQTAATP